MSSAFGTGRGMVVAEEGEGWVPGRGLQAECYTSVRMTSISVRGSSGGCTMSVPSV